MQSTMADQTSAMASYTTLTDPTFLVGLQSILHPMREQGASDDDLRAVAARAEAFFLSTRAEPDLQQPQPDAALVPSSLAPSDPQPSASLASTPSQPTSTSDTATAHSSLNAAEAADEPPYPPTFAELAQMIATGAPVPGIRDIPDLLAEEKPSQSTAQPPKKPWERYGDDAEAATGSGS